MNSQALPTAATRGVDSAYAWWRLMAVLALMTIGSSAMYVISVVLPAVQSDFGVARSDASLPYAALMVGFGLGGIFMGRLADRVGVMVSVLVGAVGLAGGFVAATLAPGIGVFTLVHGLGLGFFGMSATFAPLVADTSLWFVRRRGIAVAICASGNYLAGAVWPPIVQQVVDASGWRTAYLMLAAVCLVTMPLLALVLRPRPPLATTPGASPSAGPKNGVARADGRPFGLSDVRPFGLSDVRPFGLSPGRAQALLCVAGVGCCVAMSMPQVHIVAYCGDLGYGAARGAEMLSLMLAFGIASRLISGAICDRIGGLRTLLLGSVLQGLSLALFIPFDSLTSLYVISALFGLFQGGIVPSYAIIVREHFPASEAGSRVGTVLMFTMLGMALGGWMSGKVFDLTGSYTAAFVNGLVFNLVNLTVVLLLMRRLGRGGGDGTGQGTGQGGQRRPGFSVPPSRVLTPAGGAAGA